MSKLKKIVIPIVVILGLIIWAVVYYFMPKTFGRNINPSEVDHINVFDGNTGTGFTITNPEDIKYIVENIQSHSMNKEGISLGRMGYSLKISYIDSNDKDVIPVFILNSDDIIRKDPFFYVCDGGLCFDYIKSLKPETMSATVVEVNGQSVLVTGEVSNDLYHLSVSGLALEKNLVVGDIIEITYSGGIQESYPAGFNRVLSVNIIDHDDKVQGILLQE